MKIQSINLHKQNYQQNSSKKMEKISFKEKNDEFTRINQNPKKENIFAKFINSLQSKQLTIEEEEKSEDIDFIISNILDNINSFKKIGKAYYSLAKNSLLIGLNNDFRQYCNFNKKTGEKLIFGEIDENTKFPKSLSQISMNEGMRTKRRYEFIDGLDSFIFWENSSKEIEDEGIIKNKKIVLLKETDKKLQRVQSYMITANGFIYTDSNLKAPEEETILNTFIRYSKKDKEKNIYIQRNICEDTFDIYSYDKISKLWKKSKTTDSIEEEFDVK